MTERNPFPEHLAEAVAQHFPDIELLYLDRSHSAIEAFSRVLGRLTRLRYLHVVHDDRMTGAREILTTVSQLNQLESLQLWNGWLTNTSAKALLQHPKMRYLVLAPMSERDDGKRGGAGANSLTASMLTSIVAKMPELHYLETVRCQLAGRFDWSVWSGLQHLETIKFRWSSITDEQLENISFLYRLKHLDLYFAPITGNALIELSAISSLEYLGIFDTKIKSGISYLSPLDNLQLGCNPQMFTEPLSEEELVLLMKYGVRRPYGNDKNNGVGQFSLAKMTQEFQVVDSIQQAGSSTVLSQRSNEALGHAEKELALGRRLAVADFQSMKELNGLAYLGLNQVITHEETQYLRELTDLETVRFEHAHIDRAWVTDLATNKKLATVIIEKATIESNAFKNSKGWNALRFLEIKEIQFADEDVDRCRGIEGFPRLKRLTLGGTELTDRDVETLARVRSLESLVAHGEFTRSLIPKLAASPSLENVGLIGIKLANVEHDLLPLANSKIRYVRLSDSTDSPHFGNIYSKSVATRLGITMAGECSCGCMDVQP